MPIITFIKNIHIINPNWKKTHLEQVIGRGIRYCSHIELDTPERNVTVFLHVSGNDPEKESIDTYTYRVAEQKASQERIQNLTVANNEANEKVEELRNKFARHDLELYILSKL